MSNTGKTTRDIIVLKALEMYNAYGVEYVGVRELAKELDTKGGNITYYFPTKNDLLEELSNRLIASNNEILNQVKAPGLYGFLEMNRKLFFNQYQYRAYFLSLPLWLKQDVLFAASYHKLQLERRKAFLKELKELVTSGYLVPVAGDELKPLLEVLGSTSRLWITEATMDGLIDDERKSVHTYITRFAGLLSLIATKEGKANIKQFLKSLNK